MKKILVALLILSVMGGVFAQEGSWSIGGYLELGATIDFTGGSSVLSPVWKDDTGAGPDVILNPKYGTGPGKDPNAPQYILDPDYVKTPGYGAPAGAALKAAYISDPRIVPFNDSWWANHNRARIGIDYNKGAVSLGFAFESDEQDGDKIKGTLGYSGENYGFSFQAALKDVLNGIGTGIGKGIDIGEASGFYNFLDGKIYVKANGAGGWDQWWVGDTSYKVLDDNGVDYRKYGGRGDHLAILNGQDLGVNFKLMDGLEFGVIFNNVSLADNKDNTFKLFDVETVFGAKYSKDALNIAAQFAVESAGVYFGAGYGIGDLSFGLSLRTHFSDLNKYKVKSERVVTSNPTKLDDSDEYTGLIGNDVSYTPFGLGVGVNYNAGALSAGLKVGFGFIPEISVKATATDKKATVDAYQMIVINPTVSYNVLPDSLQAGLEAVVKIDTRKIQDPFKVYSATDTEYAYIDTPIYFHAKPYILYNFKNTGAGDWSTGIKVSYKVGTTGNYVFTDGKYAATTTDFAAGAMGYVKPWKTGIDINELNITFRWSM